MRNWERPMAVVDAFVANEFVSACKDENKEYLFTCDAGGGVHGSVYLETNGRPGFQEGTPILGIGGDRYLSGYYACGTTHTAKTTSEFKQGYYINNGKVTEVIVWRGPKNNDTHCTTNLKMNTWITQKS